MPLVSSLVRRYAVRCMSAVKMGRGDELENVTHLREILYSLEAWRWIARRSSLVRSASAVSGRSATTSVRGALS